MEINVLTEPSFISVKLFAPNLQKDIKIFGSINSNSTLSMYRCLYKDAIPHVN